MKIIQSGTFETRAGGVATCVYTMLESLNEIGIDAQLFAYKPEKDSKLVGETVKVNYTRPPIKLKLNKLQVSFGYKKNLRKLEKVDVYHANGVWLYDTYAMVDVARETKKPYVIMPHGMLYPQDISKSNKELKRLFLRIRLLNDLNNAACVITTCREEMKHCRELGISAPIAVIPNSIKVTTYSDKKFSDEQRVIGYIGRVSRRKNIEGLIYAWNDVKQSCQTRSEREFFEKSKLMIIGAGDDEYMNFLQKEVQRLRLSNVVFTGFLAGENKDAALEKIDVLCMPSEFENFGMVITEGLIRGIPCIATKGAPWEDLESYNCGWWVDYSQKSINAAVKTAFYISKVQLEQMSKNGIELVKKKYSTDITARQFEELYQWIVGEEQQPTFVYKI